MALNQVVDQILNDPAQAAEQRLIFENALLRMLALMYHPNECHGTKFYLDLKSMVTTRTRHNTFQAKFSAHLQALGVDQTPPAQPSRVENISVLMGRLLARIDRPELEFTLNHSNVARARLSGHPTNPIRAEIFDSLEYEHDSPNTLQSAHQVLLEAGHGIEPLVDMITHGIAVKQAYSEYENQKRAYLTQYRTNPELVTREMLNNDRVILDDIWGEVRRLVGIFSNSKEELDPLACARVGVVTDAAGPWEFLKFQVASLDNWTNLLQVTNNVMLKVTEEETRLNDIYSDQRAFLERGGARDREEREYTRKINGFSENFSRLYEQLEVITTNRTAKHIDSYLRKLNVVIRDYQDLGKLGVPPDRVRCRNLEDGGLHPVTVIDWCEATEESLLELKDIEEKEKEEDKTKTRLKNKQIEENLGNQTLPSLSNALDYYNWARVVKHLQDNTNHLEPEQRRLRLKTRLLTSIANQEHKNRVCGLDCPNEILQQLTRLLGTVAALAGEARVQLSKLEPPKGKKINIAGVQLGLKIFEAFRQASPAPVAAAAMLDPVQAATEAAQRGLDNIDQSLITLICERIFSPHHRNIILNEWSTHLAVKDSEAINMVAGRPVSIAERGLMAYARPRQIRDRDFDPTVAYIDQDNIRESRERKAFVYINLEKLLNEANQSENLGLVEVKQPTSTQQVKSELSYQARLNRLGVELSEGISNGTDNNGQKHSGGAPKSFREWEGKVVERTGSKPFKGKLGPCPLRCGKSHPWSSARFCPEFTASTVEKRKYIADKIGLCYVCLARGHIASKCSAKLRCHLKCGNSSRHNAAICTALPGQASEISSNNIEAKLYRLSSIEGILTMSEPPDPEEDTLDEEEYVSLARLVVEEELEEDEDDEVFTADVSLFRMSTIVEETIMKESPTNFNHALRRMESHQFSAGDQHIFGKLQDQHGLDYQDEKINSLLTQEYQLFKEQPEPSDEIQTNLVFPAESHNNVTRSMIIDEIPDGVDQEMIEISNFHIMNIPNNKNKEDVFASVTTVCIKPPPMINLNDRRLTVCGDVRGYPVTTLFDTGADRTFIRDSVAEELQLVSNKACYLKIKMAAKDISIISKIYEGSIIIKGGGEVQFTAYGCPELGNVNIPNKDTLNRLEAVLPPAIPLSDLGFPTSEKSELIIGLDLAPFMMEGVRYLNRLKIKGVKFYSSPLAPLPWIVGYLDKNKSKTPTHDDEEPQETRLLKTAVQAVSEYILNEGEIDLSPERCPAHKTGITNCFECNISMQLHAKSQKTIDDFDEKTTLIELENGKKQFVVGYSFEDCPKEVFLPELSNKEPATKQARKSISKMIDEIGLEKVSDMYQRGVKEGAFEILTEDEAKVVLAKPHSFVYQQIAHNPKSKTTPLRHITNPSNYNKKAFSSLNMNQAMPPNLQNKLIWALSAFTIWAVPYSADISHAYRCFLVKPEHQVFQLMVGFDFAQKNWQDHPILVKLKTLLYGAAQSGAILENSIRKYVAPTVTDPIAKFILTYLRLVDNILSSFRTKDEWIRVATVINEVLSEYSLDLKNIGETTMEFTDNWNNDDWLDIIFGYIWDKKKDLLQPNIKFNLYGKRAGKELGPSVDIEPPIPSQWTKRKALRVAMQKYDPRGLSSAPFEMLVKLTYREICQVMGSNEDQPIVQVSESLANKVNEAMGILFTINQILPFVRGMAELGDTIITIIVSKDGSLVGFSAAVHVICLKKTGKIYSNIFRCMSKLHIASVPLNEAKGFVLAARMLEDFLPILFIHMTPEEVADLKIIVIGDNIPVQQCFQSPSPDTLIRNAMQKATTLFKALSEINNVKVAIGFIEGKSNPADIGSKVSKFPIKDGNSSLWRNGPKIYLDFNHLAQEVFCVFQGNKILFPNSVRSQKTLPTFPPPDTCLSQKQNLEKIEVNQVNIMRMEIDEQTDEDDLAPSATPGEIVTPTEGSIAKIIAMTTRPMWIGQPLPACMTHLQITKEWYLEIVQNSSCITRLLAKVIGPLQWINRYRNKKNNQQQLLKQEVIIAAWQLIVMASQNAYPVIPRAGQTMVMKNGVITVHPGLDTKAAMIAFGTRFVPAIGHDEQLKGIIIHMAHQAKIPTVGRGQTHRGLGATLAQTRTGPFPVLAANMLQSITQTTLKNCRACQVERQKPYAVRVPSYIRLVNSSIMAHCSIDLLGPITVRNKSEGRGVTKNYLLVAICVATSLNEIILTDGYSAGAVMRALLTLQARYNPIKKLITDRGSQLGSLDMHGFEPETGQQLGVLCLLEEAKQAATRGQRENAVEATIKIIKRAWKGLFVEKHAVLPHLSHTELNLLIAYTTKLINSRPYHPDSPLAPCHLIGVKALQPLELSLNMTNKGASDLEKTLSKLSAHHTAMVNQLKNLRLIDHRTWRTRALGLAGPSPAEGDIVLVKDGQPVGHRPKIGRILEIHQTSANVMCTPKNNISKFKLDNLVLLCRGNPIHPEEDQDLDQLLNNAEQM